MMTSSGFLAICVAALMVVFIILSLLALIMILIIRFFPEKDQSDQSVLIAALGAAVKAHFPDKKIIKIEEVK
jgi:hypothetical protein